MPIDPPFRVRNSADGTASGAHRLPRDLLARLSAKTPSLWLNPSLGAALPAGAPSASDVAGAEDRFRRCGGLLARLFPELGPGAAIVESELVRTLRLQARSGSDPARDGTWLVKCDHALPVAGSIKARGGIHEVLALAERVAREAGLLGEDDDRLRMADPDLRALFSRHTIAVGSTGNLGLSIGTAAAALGFATEVHMSVDAKAWKKARLRARGVTVIEHAGDYAAAVAAGRADADGHCRHFVDDERSPLLFLGYAAAARHLSRQIAALGRRVDADHPLFVYLPCGVGGGPGGVTHGLKHLYGEAVHCFFAEPVAAPCMLVQLAAGTDAPVSVYDVGLDNRTEADGLAVGLASPFVSPLMASQLSGVFTVEDDRLFMDLACIAEAEGIEIEPSAAAGIGGPDWLTRSDPGRLYLRRHGLEVRMPNATHVIWTTGGSLVPPQEQAAFRERGLRLLAQREAAQPGRSRADLEHA